MSARRARSSHGVATHDGHVSARSSVEIELRIATTAFSHFSEHLLHGTEEPLAFRVTERAKLPFRIDPGIKENVLQNTVSQTRDALLGGKERLGAELLDPGRRDQLLEVRLVELILLKR